jgi:Carboxypeptidase regulatory-like domain
MKLSRVRLVCIVILLISPDSSWPQEATARIFGTTSDAAGAPVPSVAITVTNTATGVSRKATTNHDGYYQVLALPLGDYRVIAQREDFDTVVSDPYRLLINQVLRVDIQLRVGQTTQAAEGGARASMVLAPAITAWQVAELIPSRICSMVE